MDQPTSLQARAPETCRGELQPALRRRALPPLLPRRARQLRDLRHAAWAHHRHRVIRAAHRAPRAVRAAGAAVGAALPQRAAAAPGDPRPAPVLARPRAHLAAGRTERFRRRFKKRLRDPEPFSFAPQSGSDTCVRKKSCRRSRRRQRHRRRRPPTWRISPIPISWYLARSAP